MTTNVSTSHVLPVAILATVAPAMAKKDVRFYLNGARLEADPDGCARATATDGHAALTAVHRGCTYNGPALTLPRDFVEAIVKAAKGKGEFELSVRPWEQQEGHATAIRYDLWAKVGAVTLAAQDVGGRYPEWQAVMPFAGPFTGTAAVDAGIIEQTAKGAKALGKALEMRRTPALRFLSRHENAALAVVFELPADCAVQVAGVVMPIRPCVSVDAAADRPLEYAMPRAPVAAAADEAFPVAA